MFFFSLYYLVSTKIKINDFFILLFKTNNTVAKPFYLEMYAVNIGNTSISCQLLSIYLYLK